MAFGEECAAGVPCNDAELSRMLDVFSRVELRSRLRADQTRVSFEKVRGYVDDDAAGFDDEQQRRVGESVRTDIL